MDQEPAAHQEDAAGLQLPAPLPADAKVRGCHLLRDSGQIFDNALAASIMVPKLRLQGKQLFFSNERKQLIVLIKRMTSHNTNDRPVFYHWPI